MGSPVVWLAIFGWPFRVVIECTVDSRYNKLLGSGEVALLCPDCRDSEVQGGFGIWDQGNCFVIS